VDCDEGAFHRIATVIDIASRRVVGFALAGHLRTELVADALANAVAARDPEPGVIFHSDYAEDGVKPRNLRMACSGGAC
jgi:transposase InsO family protein